jgi:hypothetical protein
MQDERWSDAIARRPDNPDVMRLILLVAITIVVGLFSFQPVPAVGQSRVPYGVFRGRIVDTDGNIIRGASVNIEATNYHRAVKPTGDGHFGIELPVGVYKIVVKKSGFATSELTDVVVRAGGYASHVFRLERPNRQSSNSRDALGTNRRR